MKTKGIPAVVMLLAGFVTCIIGIVQHMETDVFIKTLLAVLIIFYLLGCIVKLVFDKNFKEMDEPEENQEGPLPADIRLPDILPDSAYNQIFPE